MLVAHYLVEWYSLVDGGGVHNDVLSYWMMEVQAVTFCMVMGVAIDDENGDGMTWVVVQLP
jgi:hypothetical protein